MDYHSAFAGIKVVDLSGGVAGPSCAMMLAQHGADVIKVETPHHGGDWSRILGRTYEQHSAFSLYGTLGKRSVAVDLKTDEGKAILGLLGFQAIATSLYVRREQAVKQGRFLELSLMQGGAMLSVIRMIANYLERG